MSGTIFPGTRRIWHLLCFIYLRMSRLFCFRHFSLVMFWMIQTLVFFLFAPSVLADFSLEVNHINEVTHIEIPGISPSDYSVSQKPGYIELQISGLDSKSAERLSRYSDRFIKNIVVRKSQSLSKDVIEIHMADADVEVFDYLTDAPASLSIDLYVDENKEAKKSDLAALEALAKPKKKAAKGDEPTEQNDRKPSSEFIKSIGGSASLVNELEEGGLLKGITFKQADNDKKPRRDKGLVKIAAEAKLVSLLAFEADKVKFTKDSIIESRGKIFLKFPILLNDSEYLNYILSRRVDYAASDKTDGENKDAIKAKKMFDRGDYRSFFKAKKIFSKKYPQSKYTEMLAFMDADAYYNLYQEEKNLVFLDQALRNYDGLISKYPASPLAERTLLLVAILRMNQGNHFDAVRNLRAYVQKYETSPLKQNIELVLAQNLLRINELKDSLTVYEKLLMEGNDDVREQARCEVGDVFLQKKDYPKAQRFYEQALEEQPKCAQKHPNLYFNLAETQFMTEQYQKSLESFKTFITRFPQHPFASYAWTRLGEIFEISEVEEKIWRGYYNESVFRFQNSNGGKVARIHLLSHQADTVDEKRLPLVMKELEGYNKQISLPNSDEFLIFKISDIHFSRGAYKTATNELIDFFKGAKIPVFADKFHRRIGRGIAFQARTALDEKKYDQVFSLLDSYDPLWLRRAERIDYGYIRGAAYEGGQIYPQAAKEYEAFLEQMTKLPNIEDAIVQQKLPKVEDVKLSLASVLVGAKEYAKAEEQLKKMDVAALSAPGQDKFYYLLACMAEAKSDFANAIAQMELVKTMDIDMVKFMASLQSRNDQAGKAVASIDSYLDSKKITGDQRFELLKLKLGYLEKAGPKDKYFTFLQKFYSEFKDKKMDFDKEKYRLGGWFIEKNKRKEAADVWATISPNSIWAKLAKEQSESDKWDQQYKKYLDRIPAMTQPEGKKQ